MAIVTFIALRGNRKQLNELKKQRQEQERQNDLFEKDMRLSIIPQLDHYYLYYRDGIITFGIINIGDSATLTLIDTNSESLIQNSNPFPCTLHENDKMNIYIDYSGKNAFEKAEFSMTLFLNDKLGNNYKASLIMDKGQYRISTLTFIPQESQS